MAKKKKIENDSLNEIIENKEGENTSDVALNECGEDVINLNNTTIEEGQSVIKGNDKKFFDEFSLLFS